MCYCEVKSWEEGGEDDGGGREWSERRKGEESFLLQIINSAYYIVQYHVIHSAMGEKFLFTEIYITSSHK